MNKLTRREFIISMSQFSLTGVALCYLPLAQADCCRLSWWSIFRLQPARIIAGLIFDEVAPVAVRWVASGVSDLFSGHYSIYDSEAYKSLTNETLFNHPAYKAAIVTLGVADYEKHRQRQIRLLLNNAVDYNRFNLIRDYLREEKIALKTSDQEISYPIGVDLEPDDLFTVDYFVMGENSAQHYTNLEQITKVNVFNQWHTG